MHMHITLLPYFNVYIACVHAYNLIRAGTHSLHLWGMHCVTVLYNCLSVSIIYSEAPLNDHLYKATTLEIRPLWFSPKSMIVYMYYGSQN